MHLTLTWQCLYVPTENCLPHRCRLRPFMDKPTNFSRLCQCRLVGFKNRVGGRAAGQQDIGAGINVRYEFMCALALYLELRGTSGMQFKAAVRPTLSGLA